MLMKCLQVITINTKINVHGSNVSKRSDTDNLNKGDHVIHLDAFGKEFFVPLKRNLNILSPFANIVDTSLDPITGKG